MLFKGLCIISEAAFHCINIVKQEQWMMSHSEALRVEVMNDEHL